jgi:hypothetical protein
MVVDRARAFGNAGSWQILPRFSMTEVRTVLAPMSSVNGCIEPFRGFENPADQSLRNLAG